MNRTFDVWRVTRDGRRVFVARESEIVGMEGCAVEIRATGSRVFTERDAPVCYISRPRPPIGDDGTRATLWGQYAAGSEELACEKALQDFGRPGSKP